MRKRIITCVIAVIGLMGCRNENSGFLVIGHRGAMGHETENTLASVQKALDLGVDMIEIDVFKIQSGEIVVFHDDRVERLTNGGGNIEEYNIYDLKKLLLDGNHRIPMLQDVLKLIDNKVKLNIELKGANTADRVNHIIGYYVEERGWSANNFIISSFKWDELRAIRGFNKEIEIAVLTEDNPLDAIEVARELNAVAINPNFKSLNEENVRKIKEAGFKIYTWTVNEVSDISRMKELDVDGIFTNYPERAH
ncbi:glycerophosphoryl diester phosphodiesterase [Saonia flava]|uniref:Glycerophosphoryl diester phosphodiesterase n=1 Tax=Saonia flava TaxID=523696 RepID=A0A846QY10_9FLAO|nr:glycerophosphodiester phosphodiesterase [Saonia flava]NJB71830.1 glycerophosphoryl diester phosphodiesterase [Saonia flava]